MAPWLPAVNFRHAEAPRCIPYGAIRSPFSHDATVARLSRFAGDFPWLRALRPVVMTVVPLLAATFITQHGHCT